MNIKQELKCFPLDRVTTIVFLSILLPQIAMAQPLQSDVEIVLFSDNFDSYPAGSGLAGQGGWYQDAERTAPQILSTGGHFGSTYVDGTIRPGTISDDISNLSYVSHSLSGPLNPNGISIFSADAYAFSDLPSVDSGIGLGTPDEATKGIGPYFEFYPNPPRAQTWQFVSGDGSIFDFLSGGFDQRVHIQIIIDGSAGEYYARLTDSAGGVSETPHRPITSSTIASLNTISLIQDYRGAYGVELDNVVITTSAVPVPAAFWLFGSGLAGLIMSVFRRS